MDNTMKRVIEAIKDKTKDTIFLVPKDLMILDPQEHAENKFKVFYDRYLKEKRSIKQDNFLHGGHAKKHHRKKYKGW